MHHWVKYCVNRCMKSEVIALTSFVTDRRTDAQKDGHTDGRLAFLCPPPQWLHHGGGQKLFLLLPRTGANPRPPAYTRLHNKQGVPYTNRSAIGRRLIWYIIIWSHDTRLTILIIFRGWISQDNLSVARDSNNLSVLILNLLRIRGVIIYNLMTLHSYHNRCGNIWRITGKFTKVKCSASKVCQWIFSNSFYKWT